MPQITTAAGPPPVISPKTQRIFIITKGPETLESLQDAAATATTVRFKFMFGLFCPPVNDELARIEPLMLASPSMGVRIDALCTERESPHGVAMDATIIEIPQYYRNIVGNHQLDTLKLAIPGRRIRISYNYQSLCGGFALGPQDPLINSLSDLTRIYVKGASFYAVTSTAKELPTTHTLPSFTDPLVEQFILGEIPIPGHM